MGKSTDNEKEAYLSFHADGIIQDSGTPGGFPSSRQHGAGQGLRSVGWVGEILVQRRFQGHLKITSLPDHYGRTRLALRLRGASH